MTVSKRYVGSRFDVDSVGSGRVEVSVSTDGAVRIRDLKDLDKSITIYVSDWLRLAEAIRALEVKR